MPRVASATSDIAAAIKPRKHVLRKVGAITLQAGCRGETERLPNGPRARILLSFKYSSARHNPT